jgi:two-component system phosphate regulon sensor histidine kinase PhoR
MIRRGLALSYLHHPVIIAVIVAAAGLVAGATLRVTAIRLDGTVLGDLETEIATLENHLDREEFLAARQGRTGVASRFSASVGRRLIYQALPAVVNRNASLVVRVSTAEQNLRAELRASYGRLAWRVSPC